MILLYVKIPSYINRRNSICLFDDEFNVVCGGVEDSVYSVYNSFYKFDPVTSIFSKKSELHFNDCESFLLVIKS